MTRLAPTLLCLLCLAPPEVWAQGSLTVDEVKVRGNRRSEADAILGVVATRAGTILDRARVRTDIRAIFQLGFYTDVQVDLTETDKRWVLTYIVREKPSVRRVIYEGNEEIDDEELGEVVDVKAFGVLDLAKVNRNAEKVKDLYVEKGYFLAEVDWDVVELPDNEVDVVFRIVEKEEVKVARVLIVGNDALSDAFIEEKLETREGSYLGFLTGAGSFKNEAFERDLVRVAQFYYDQGYIKARSAPRRSSSAPTAAPSTSPFRWMRVSATAPETSGSAATSSSPRRS